MFTEIPAAAQAGVGESTGTHHELLFIHVNLEFLSEVLSNTKWLK